MNPGRGPGVARAPGRDGSPEGSYDPMRQFSELAGDVRDPYPMMAEIRAGSPVLEVNMGARLDRYRHDETAPKIPTLFTVTSHEYAQQVLTYNERFFSARYAVAL